MKDYTKLNRAVDKAKKLESGKQEQASNAKAFLILAAFLASIAASFLINEISFSDILKDNPPAPEREHREHPIQNQQTDIYQNPFPEIEQKIPLNMAYEMTNVERVIYSKEKSKLSPAESDYLSQLFRITDFLVIERIQNENKLRNKEPLNLAAYDLADAKLQQMQVPEKAKHIHVLIKNAILNQKYYYQVRQNTGEEFDVASPYVQSAHQHLLTAWDFLKKNFPDENKDNIRSFEKHLCAMDFI